jgi:hypothetical protein
MMSFLSDIFHGNFGNLGNDLFGSPTAIAETLGAVAAPFALAAAPELLGAAFLPTVGEGALGLEAGAAAPASLGAAFGGVGDLAAVGGAGASGLDTGGGALAFSGEPAAANPVASLDALAPAANAPATAPAAVPSAGMPSWATGPDLGNLYGPLASDTTGGGALPYSSTTDPAFTFGTSPIPSAPANVGAAGGPTAFGSVGGGAPSAPAGGGIMDALKGAGAFAKDVAPVAGLAGLGLTGYNAYQEKQALAKTSQQEATAAGQAAQTAQQTQAAAAPLITSGETLMKYLTTGTLPPEFQAQVKQNIDAMKAQIIQGYASRGMSTNPAQNSALAQDLANADLQAETLKANLESTLSTAGNQMVQTANGLLASGISATQLSAQIPIMMQTLNTTLAAETSKALASFAAAMNSGGGTGQKFTLSAAA